MFNYQVNNAYIKAKTILKTVLVLVFIFNGFLLKANTSIEKNSSLGNEEGILINDISVDVTINIKDKRPNPILQLFRIKQRKNKRVTAAILAFPFPFGIVGLHRIYLGTAPHVPVVYIGSLGGIFGILPFIDFCVLVLEKDIERYTENKKVFMWVN